MIDPVTLLLGLCFLGMTLNNVCLTRQNRQLAAGLDRALAEIAHTQRNMRIESHNLWRELDRVERPRLVLEGSLN